MLFRVFRCCCRVDRVLSVSGLSSIQHQYVHHQHIRTSMNRCVFGYSAGYLINNLYRSKLRSRTIFFANVYICTSQHINCLIVCASMMPLSLSLFCCVETNTENCVYDFCLMGSCALLRMRDIKTNNKFPNRWLNALNQQHDARCECGQCEPKKKKKQMLTSSNRETYISRFYWCAL